MPITVTFLDDAGVIEAVFPETFGLDELYAGLGQTMALAEERGCRRFLVDTRAISQEGDSFDILRLAEHLSAMPDGSIEREAILPPEGGPAAGDFRFFETAARNRGLNVRIMTSRDAAIAWLSAE